MWARYGFSTMSGFPGGSYAPVQLSLSGLQERVLENPDSLGAWEGQDRLPPLQKQRRGAAVGGLLCSDLEEELEGWTSGAISHEQFGSCDVDVQLSYMPRLTQ